jgi:hypothetical protein
MAGEDRSAAPAAMPFSAVRRVMRDERVCSVLVMMSGSPVGRLFTGWMKLRRRTSQRKELRQAIEFIAY